MKKINQNGRSMVEMLGVLAIIGVLSAGGLAGYSKAMFKHKLNSTMDQITMLVTNIRTVYGAQANYEGLADDAISLGIVPSVMGNAMDALTSPFKGTVTINTSSTGGDAADNTAFTLTYAGLPTEACIALATADFGSGAGSGFIGVTIGEEAKGAAVGQGIGDRNEGTAYKVTDAIGECSAEAQRDAATVSWKFY